MTGSIHRDVLDVRDDLNTARLMATVLESGIRGSASLDKDERDALSWFAAEVAERLKTIEDQLEPPASTGRSS